MSGNYLIQHYASVLDSLFDDETIDEIMVNRYDDIWVEKGGKMLKTDCTFESEEKVLNFLTVLGNELDQPFNQEHPIIDTRLPDGSRLSATHNALSPAGTSISIRIHRGQSFSVQDLIKFRTLDEAMLDYIKDAFVSAKNILVSGSTSAGKTTTINLFSTFIPDDQRVLFVEDSKELVLDIPNQVSFEIPKVRVKDESLRIRFSDLIKHTLRRKPDRILVGEIRDGQAAHAFIRAMTTGHTGVCTTIHANSGRNAFRTLVNLASEVSSQIPYEIQAEFVSDAVDVLIHMSRHPTEPKRKIVKEIVEVGSGPEFKPQFYYDFTSDRFVGS